MDVLDLAELSAGRQIRERLERRMIPQHVAGHGRQPRGFGRIDHAPGVVHRQRNRLFDQEVFSRLDDGERRFGMFMRGQGEHHAVDPVVGQHVIKGKCHAAIGCDHGVGLFRIAIADRTQSAQAGERADMVAAPDAAADDRNFEIMGGGCVIRHEFSVRTFLVACHGRVSRVAAALSMGPKRARPLFRGDD